MRAWIGGGTNHEDKMKSLAASYAYQREAILEGHKDDDDVMNLKLDELDQAFKSFLGTTTSTLLRPPVDIPVPYVSSDPEEAARIEERHAAIAEHNAKLESVAEIFNGNMQRHIDTFYEAFTSAIKEKDFEAAYEESMALLKDTETTSAEDISYDDMQSIMDVLRNEPVEFGPDGKPTKFRYESVDDALAALCMDDRVPMCVRDHVSELFGYPQLSMSDQFAKKLESEADWHENVLRDLAEKYTSLRDEILKTFKDEDRMEQKLGELDYSFKQALESTYQKLLRNSTLHELGAEFVSIKQNFDDNMVRHLSAFFDSFTAVIKEKDFDAAFDESMDLLRDTSTMSYEELSYSDMMKIIDIMRNDPVAYDEDGKPAKLRYSSREEMLDALFSNKGVPSCFKDKISELLGLSHS
jgi:hypothetical protein